MEKNWWHGGVVYQIMPDRFHIGGNRTVFDKIKSGLYDQEVQTSGWETPPSRSRGHSFYGGDLEGVIEKLDYIKDQGTTILYLTPFFSSPSYHKYDALSYQEVDRAMGDMGVFQRLLDEAHKRGMRLIIDVALNHVSWEHPLFKEAVSDADSPYRDFFIFNQYPHQYQCWRGHKRMPELNLDNPAVRERFISGKESVIRFWLEKGVDGIRLDCANDLGVPILELIFKLVKEINPEAFLVGELFNFAPHFCRYLDSLQNYFFTSSIFSFLTAKISAGQFGMNLQRSVEAYPWEKLLANFVILSSQDSERALSKVKGSIKLMELAFLMQFTLPGIPMTYYGEEIGMKGKGDPYNRAPMIWDQKRWNSRLKSFRKRMVRLRGERAELRGGQIMVLTQAVDNGVAAYLRYDQEDPRQFALVVVNPGKKRKCRLYIPYSYLFDNLLLRDLLSQQSVKSFMSYVDLKLPAHSGAVYVPDSRYLTNYDFYKRAAPLPI